VVGEKRRRRHRRRRRRRDLALWDVRWRGELAHEIGPCCRGF